MSPPSGSAQAMVPLVIRYGRLGDMVLQEPLLHLLHRRYGQPCCLLTRGTWTQALYRDHPDVGEIGQLLHRHRPLLLSPERWRMIARLRAHKGPIYVSEDTRASLAHIRWLLRFAGVSRGQCVFLRETELRPDEHGVDQNLRLGRMTPAFWREFDYPWGAADMRTAPQLHISATDRSDASQWLRQRGCADAPLVLLQPGNWKVKRRTHAGKDDPKFWPIQHWATLLHAMHASLPDAHFILCGAPAEAPVCEAIASAANLRQVHIAATDLPVRRLMAVLERAHSMVSVDTGPAHLAAAMGCPLVVLYGGKYGPQKWGRRSPCGKPVVELVVSPQPVSRITPEQVIAAWRSLATT